MRHLQLATVVGALFLAGLGAAGDETEMMFEALFGARIRAAKGTREHEDDLKLAAEMISTVQNTELSAALTSRICLQVESLVGRLPGGLDLALASMRLLAKNVPASRPEAQGKINQLLVHAHGAARGDDKKRVSAMIVAGCESRGGALAQAGDWKGAAEQYALGGRYASEAADRERLKGKYTVAVVNTRVMAELVQLTARVRKNPRDRSARERIMTLHLTYNDSPAEAAKWLADDCSEDFRRHIPLAAGKLTALTSTDCATLTKWYGQLLDKTGQMARVSLMVRLRRYVRMFLAAKDIDPTSRAKAAKALVQIESALKHAGRADLVTDEKVPTPRAETVRGRVPDNKGEPVSPPTPPRLEGADKVLTFTTGAGRRFASSITVRGNARINKNGKMTFNVGAVLTDAGPAIYEACRRSSQLTIAATIIPDNDIERGPARIITFSSTTNLRNFTLGQQEQSLVFRLRTSGNGSNGANHEPKLCTLKARRPTRVVVTYARDMVNCYVDGRHVMKTDKIRGDFRNWDRKQTMMFGDERDDSRPWHGVVQDVGIYSRALSAEEAIKLSIPR